MIVDLRKLKEELNFHPERGWKVTVELPSTTPPRFDIKNVYWDMDKKVVVLILDV